MNKQKKKANLLNHQINQKKVNRFVHNQNKVLPKYLNNKLIVKLSKLH